MSVHFRGIHKIGHVTGATKAPNDEDVEAFAKWEDDDGFMTSVLFKAMTDNVLQIVKECDTTEAIWRTLGDLYTNKSYLYRFMN